jgi:hypothetical protein
MEFAFNYEKTSFYKIFKPNYELDYYSLNDIRNSI